MLRWFVVVALVVKIVWAQSCTYGTCAANETCCESPSGPSCAIGAGACCCPDEQHACRAGTSCQCQGNCPGPNCTCTGCVKGSSGSCVSNYSPYCSAAVCGPEQTCCFSDANKPSCCALPNATCCGIDNKCCPEGTVCDPVASTCVKPNLSSPNCSSCLYVVGKLQSYGCDYACDFFPPPTNLVCEALEALGICSWVAGNASLAVCSLAGYCNSGTCACGYCTRYVYGRCLSFPNACPSETKIAATATVITKSGICIDGTCEPGYEGCCLTCL